MHISKLLFCPVGPVFVEFPIDTLYPYPLVKKESGLKVSTFFLCDIVLYYVSPTDPVLNVHLSSLNVRVCDLQKWNAFPKNTQSVWYACILTCDIFTQNNLWLAVYPYS